MAVSQQTFARKKPDQLVYLELGSANGGMLLSISEDGFRFRAVSPLRANGAVPFAFSLDGTHRLEGMGEIEWLEDDGKSGGVRFTELSDESRAALNQWLSSDARQRTSGREAAPAAVPPPDTMQKIREDLRRSHSRKRASAEQPPSQSKYEKLVLPEKPVLEGEDQGPPPPTAVPILERLMGPRRPATQPPEPPQAPVKQADPAQQPTAATPDPSEAPRLSSRIPWRPPFSKPLSESPAKPASSAPIYSGTPSPSAPSASAQGSAFLKKARDASQEHPPSATPPAMPPTGPTSLRSFALTETGDIARSASRSSVSSPAHPSPAPAAHSRPYIPPPDDSEAAWSSGKLTPPDSPHLSRAAAGSIIGLALVVILGALIVNFRQDIGEVVIDLGHTISGSAPYAPPSTAAPGSSSQSAGAPPAGATTSPDSGTSAPKETPPKNQDSSGQNQLAAPPAEPAPSGNSGKAAPMSRPATEAAANKPAASGASAKTKNKESASSKFHAADIPKTLVPESELQQPAESAGEGGSGEQEFNIARDILRGPSHQRELPAAVALLWSGVRKGYVPAEVTLADLYRRGEGVEKNCDQAQVLLVAASRKGSPDARRMLEFMVEHGGCQ